ncbi:hypothetical protein LZ30DRAFT_743764 [Colletotrichum cereale]|nr:hypothetical protein LZ30DRAFT_743764 [Colletotrichum cereale]
MSGTEHQRSPHLYRWHLHNYKANQKITHGRRYYINGLCGRVARDRPSPRNGPGRQGKRKPQEQSLYPHRQPSRNQVTERTDRYQGRQAERSVQAQVHSQDLVTQTIAPKMANRLGSRDARKNVIPSHAKTDKEGPSSPRRAH